MNKPFDEDRDNELLVSFSTRFTNTVNVETAAEVKREMQIKLDGQSRQ